ncbi:regulator of chromosome condensation-like [Lycorma delicatula]|uniref:regulator of chromosome condensation-like n=1 Tax=Lycorma delicatula TaxID=130591 RepID=UPI003F51A731
MPKRRSNVKERDTSCPLPQKIIKENIAEINSVVRKYFKKPGVVLTFGQGDVGQLGLGPDILERTRPALLSHLDLKNVVYVCAGGMHTLCLTENGQVISFGCNDEGALGREGNESEPGPITLPGKAVQVTAGDSHSAALLENGKVFAWGAFRDSHGSMGLTLDGLQKIPIRLPIDEQVIKIASGADHLVLLTANGHVYTCGCGEQGQLGRLSERAATRSSRKGLSQLLVPAPVTFQRRLKVKVDDIWAGTYCTFVKEESKGHIYAFGLNNYYQLGLRDTLPHFHPVKSELFSKKSWTLITGGQHHALGLDKEGMTYALGRREYGRLGLGENCTDASKPTQIPALKNKKCVDIACGSSVSFAVTSDGEVYAWGMGTNGQLGTGDEEDVYEPKKIQGKQLEGRSVVQVSGGGQHTVLLAV